MKGHKIVRMAMALFMGMALTLPAVSAVLAAPPNDNLADAIVILPSELPFTGSVDNTDGTTELDEPQYCNTMYSTVWYSFTPETSGVYRANMDGSFWENGLSVYWAAGPGFGGLTNLGCASWGSSTVTFVAQAGQTYYFQAGSVYDYIHGALRFNLALLWPPANDNWANAKAIQPLPYDDGLDTSGATVEPLEPSPSCSYWQILKTIWYSFTPGQTTLVSARASGPGTPIIAVYTGSALDGLTEVACRDVGWQPVTFRVEAGTTYYLQVASPSLEPNWWNVRVEVTPPPSASFYYSPSDPSAFDMVEFHDNSSDPGGVGIQAWSWNLGDGTTCTDCYPSHRYARDGDYTVSLTVTTPDGRTASTSQVVYVRTHDVAIVKLGAPQSASAGQTRHVTVDIKNNRYAENVRVELYKSSPSGYQSVGTLTNFVPVRSANRTTQFDFSYTFTADDARIGKITFRAVATIVDARDALPADNEAISSPTKVGR